MDPDPEAIRQFNLAMRGLTPIDWAGSARRYLALDPDKFAQGVQSSLNVDRALDGPQVFMTEAEFLRAMR